MTKTLLLALSLLTATLTAQPTNCPFFYAKAGPAYIVDDLGAGASFGCRYYEGRNGLDVSGAGYIGIFSSAAVLPSIRYIRMIQPSARHNVHVGIGAGYGCFSSGLFCTTEFEGLAAHASVDYDLRWGPCHFLVGADLLQPAIPFHRANRNDHWLRRTSTSYRPVISLTFGIGF